MPHRSRHNPRYITSIEGGLLVAIPVDDGRVTRTFRHTTDVSQELTLNAAIAWRDAKWMELFGSPVPSRSFHSKARDCSVTRSPGVRFIEKVVRKGNKQYVVPCVIAEVHTIPGRDYRRPSGSRSRLFSLNKYEFEEAVVLAAAWREEMLRHLAAQETAEQ